MAEASKLILDYVYAHVAQHPDRVYLTQPIGNGRVTDYTWREVLDQASRMATHLRSHGFEPGARIALLSKNTAHFFMAELAIWMAGHTTVAIFPTETAQTVGYVLDHSEASLLFVGKLDTWPDQKPGVPESMPCIALPLAPANDFETWDDIVGRTEPMAQHPARAADDLAMILYTSGSTGTPKGVMSTFEAITRAGEIANAHVRREVGPDETSRMLSYLPLSHTFERTWVEASSLVDGNMHVFFAESLDTFLADLQRARPTLFISVPRLWLKFQQGVFAKMPPEKLDRLLKIPLLGRIVARKIRAGLGLDHVKMAGSGSAPMPPNLIEWYRRIGLPLYEGYAMSEDNSISHSSDARHNEVGRVGVPMPGVQVRIAEDGEILIKSPARFKGYYKRPDLDAESFTEDGFFRTGDLGEIDAKGLLKITGRAKELFKTAKGKYVAPAPIENRINAHPMVELSMVSGVGHPAPYGIVVLAEELRPRLGQPGVRDQVHRELEALFVEVNEPSADWEILQMLVVAAEPWTIENGCLTPTMKIKRRGIEALVAPNVEAWYAAQSRIVWE
ncbi:MAG: AMP-binding protein [Burkholderiaceae bacterium]